MQKFINLIAICYWSRILIYAPRRTTTIIEPLRADRHLSLINRFNVLVSPPDEHLPPPFGIKFRRLFL